MDYNKFLFNKLLCQHLSTFDHLEYDKQYDLTLKLYSIIEINGLLSDTTKGMYEVLEDLVKDDDMVGETWFYAGQMLYDGFEIKPHDVTNKLSFKILTLNLLKSW